MKIEIAQRLRPFSHVPGTYFMLPGTALRFQLFPALIKIDDLSTAQPHPAGHLALPLKGPLEKFTIQQDLEKRQIKAWGETAEGFMRYRIEAIQEKQALFILEKSPASLPKLIQVGPALLLEEQAQAKPILKPIERLSLGNHKAQDWELMKRRADFAEIMPLWYALGQMTPSYGKASEGTALLINACRAVIGSNQTEKILPAFMRLWLAGFEGGLSPTLQDHSFQGIVSHSDSLSSKASPLQLLTEGQQLIRSLIVQEKADEIHLLPALPPNFHCGRLLSAQIENKGAIHVEWTKKSLRQLIFTANQSCLFSFHFSRGEKQCRMRCSSNDRGSKYYNGQVLEFSKQSSYWFDQFQN